MITIFLLSGAIFTKRNPFPKNPALPKTHYNPSLIQKLSKQQKKTVTHERKNLSSRKKAMHI